MLPPPGYTSAQPGDVCLLHRSLYSLKQAFRQWIIELSSKLLSYGFQQSAFDPCLFFRRTSTSFLALVVYMNDVLLAGSLEFDILQAKTFLHSVLLSKIWDLLHIFLGLSFSAIPVASIFISANIFWTSLLMLVSWVLD